MHQRIPTEPTRKAINHAWETVSNSAFEALLTAYIHCPIVDSYDQLRPFNVSTGLYVEGISAILLRSAIIEHFKQSGRWENRFIGAKDAEQHKLVPLNERSPQKSIILRYALTMAIEDIDLDSGEVVETSVNLDVPYRSYQSLNHFGQYSEVPETTFCLIDDVESGIRILTSNEVPAFVGQFVSALGVDVCYSSKALTSINIESNAIYLPHPDLFKCQQSFFKLVLSLLCSFLLRSEPLNALMETNEFHGEDVEFVVSQLSVEALISKLGIPKTPLLEKAEQETTLRRISRQPNGVIRLLLLVEQVVNYMLIKANLKESVGNELEWKSFMMKSQTYENLSRFSEKRAEAILQKSEPTLINFS